MTFQLVYCLFDMRFVHLNQRSLSIKIFSSFPTGSGCEASSTFYSSGSSGCATDSGMSYFKTSGSVVASLFVVSGCGFSSGASWVLVSSVAPTGIRFEEFISCISWTFSAEGD